MPAAWQATTLLREGKHCKKERRRAPPSKIVVTFQLHTLCTLAPL